MGTDTSIIFWLLTLTGIMLVQCAALVLLWVKLGNLPNIRDIDLNDKMDRVLSIASSDVAMRNEAIRRNVRILLESIEKDPLASERFFVQVQALKNSLQ